MAVFILILIRTTAESLLPRFMHQWDILLPFAIYFGQRRTLPEGLILTLFTSHLYSLSSIAPIGVFATHYLILFVVARLLSYAIYANTWFSILLLMFSLALLSRLSITLVSMSFGHGWPLFSGKNFVWWSLLFNAVAGYVTYSMLEVLDSITYKSTRSTIEMSEIGT